MTYGVVPSGHGRTGTIQLGFWTHHVRLHSVTVIYSNKGSTVGVWSITFRAMKKQREILTVDIPLFFIN
jgi:hypothetical protein